jgi:hypothetical protein
VGKEHQNPATKNHIICLQTPKTQVLKVEPLDLNKNSTFTKSRLNNTGVLEQTQANIYANRRIRDTAILLLRGIEAADCMSSTSQVCPAQIILPGQTKRPQHYQTISSTEFDVILLLQVK